MHSFRWSRLHRLKTSATTSHVCHALDEHATSKIMSELIPDWTKFVDRGNQPPHEFSTTMTDDIESLILRLARGPVVRATVAMPSNRPPLDVDSQAPPALNLAVSQESNDVPCPPPPPSPPRGSIRRLRSSIEVPVTFPNQELAVESMERLLNILNGPSFGPGNNLQLRAYPANLPANIQDVISRDKAAEGPKQRSLRRNQRTMDSRGRYHGFGSFSQRGSSAAPGSKLLQALWITENGLLDPPSTSAGYETASVHLNRLLVQHASSPATPWHELCMIVEPNSPFLRHLDSVTIGCLMLEIARKGPRYLPTCSTLSDPCPYTLFCFPLQ